jgi:hypothetical protein
MTNIVPIFEFSLIDHLPVISGHVIMSAPVLRSNRPKHHFPEIMGIDIDPTHSETCDLFEHINPILGFSNIYSFRGHHEDLRIACFARSPRDQEMPSQFGNVFSWMEWKSTADCAATNFLLPLLIAIRELMAEPLLSWEPKRLRSFRGFPEISLILSEQAGKH